jgi:hypothetical protein
VRSLNGLFCEEKCVKPKRGEPRASIFSRTGVSVVHLLFFGNVARKPVVLGVVGIVAQYQLVVAQLVLHAGGVDARLAARVRKQDDERIFVGVLQRRPQRQCERYHCAFGAAAETDDFQALQVIVLQRRAHFVEEVGEVGREVVRQVGEAEPFEGLCRRAADFGVVYETLKL